MKTARAKATRIAQIGYDLTLLSRTSTTLLNSLLEQPANEAAWSRFARRFGPAIYRFARRKGLSEVEADEVLSGTLAAFFEATAGASTSERELDSARGYWAWPGIKSASSGATRPDTQGVS